MQNLPQLYSAILLEESELHCAFKNPVFKNFINSVKCPVSVIDTQNLNIKKVIGFLKEVINNSRNNKFLINENQKSRIIKSALKEFYYKVSKCCNSDVTVLLTGETGSGKDYTAEFIHKNSKRKKYKFINQNIAEINPNLLESTLFGTVKNAFTGAGNTLGLFLKAGSGTFLLDEFVELSYELQAKFLGVLDKKKFFPVGSDLEREVKARLMFATDADLEGLVKEKKLRVQFLFRINVFEIKVPALREHKEDIPMLAQSFAKKRNVNISSGAIQKLLKWNWPGNIRELKNCIEKASLMCCDSFIKDADIIY